MLAAERAQAKAAAAAAQATKLEKQLKTRRAVRELPWTLAFSLRNCVKHV